MRRYDLDTVMFPVNPRLWADPAYRHDAEALLAEAEAPRRGGDGHQGRGGASVGRRPHTATTWYEAYTSDDEIDRGVRFVLSDPGVHALCTPSDPGLTLARPSRRRRASSPWPRTSGPRPWRATAAEDHIFPMPAG